jgi:hypothetical protein
MPYCLGGGIHSVSELVIPLLPLYAVLFPGGTLPLRIFEPRYLDMVSYCLRRDGKFGVCLIREGREVGKAATTYSIGTLVEITDWNRTSDGLLGIEVMGQQRFQIISRKVHANQLIEVIADPIANESAQEIPVDYLALPNLLEEFIRQIGKPYEKLPVDYGNASWISQRLAELLPMPFSQRQHLLELSDSIQRLEVIGSILKKLNILY